ncbi:hypothetical protein ASE82_08410 [Sphingomonas sp. Leaf230]|uniref:hypothetical protein n=1 Tax=Sphingomonas sp. Leaf230 TaxID=1735694 RepID=UPI0006F55597|nr:hypothetical protein [Sphingomonas sp. Leaf230]KQN02371.1 hypothetical protein ASE82_08410 [Sphingomonas sp. Leaf230]
MFGGKIGAFLGRVGDASHSYDVSTETFVQPRLERLADELRLQQDGIERGGDNVPASEDTGFDLAETRVVDRIDRERSHAENQFRDMMNTYRDRLFDLEFDTKASQIRSAAEVGVAVIGGETAKGVDRLNPLRREMLNAERYLIAFRERHGLDRPADYPQTKGERWFLYGLLFVVLVIEMLLNGVFFAQGNPLGLVGGWFQAAIFATLNIFIGWSAGRLGTTLIIHRFKPQRVAGWTIIALYVIGAVFLNLTVAHYRSAFSIDPVNPGAVAWRTMREGAFAGLDAASITMFALGIVFSIIALVDGRKMGDAYFGYDRPSGNFDRRRQDYLDDRQDLIDAVQRAYEEAHARMNEEHDDLTRKRSESRSIHEAIARITRGYDAHLGFLERLGGDLLGIYREANRKARSTPVPGHFNRRWEMPRGAPPSYGEIRYSDEEVSRITVAAKNELDAQAGLLNEAREGAMARLRSLDDLETVHGA